MVVLVNDHRRKIEDHSGYQITTGCESPMLFQLYLKGAVIVLIELLG